jgi:hypothetical protein
MFRAARYFMPKLPKRFAKFTKTYCIILRAVYGSICICWEGGNEYVFSVTLKGCSSIATTFSIMNKSRHSALFYSVSVMLSVTTYSECRFA